MHMYPVFLLKNKHKIHSCLLVLVLFFVHSLSHAYVKFNNEPVENWEALFEKSGVEKHYTVQKRDSLYDISKTLFGDPHFWPKIWSMNSKITNPHLISKGQVIYFAGGTEHTAPSIGIQVINPKTYVYGKELLRPEIPPEALRRKPIDIPDSLPNLFKGASARQEGAELASLSAGRRAAAEAFRVVEITSEITKESPTSVGVIKRVVSGSDFAQAGHLVYVSLFSGANVGDEVTVFRKNSEHLPLDGLLKTNANMVEWLGRLEIISQAHKGFIGKIIKANSFIQVGDRLSLKNISLVKIPNSINNDAVAESPSGNIKIIGANKVPGGLAIGENKVVYLNKGSQAGLEEGQVYPLYSNFGADLLGEKGAYIPRRIGFLKIAKSESTVSTGVVFDLISEVQVGQRIGL